MVIEHSVYGVTCKVKVILGTKLFKSQGQSSRLLFCIADGNRRVLPLCMQEFIVLFSAAKRARLADSIDNTEDSSASKRTTQRPDATTTTTSDERNTSTAPDVTKDGLSSVPASRANSSCLCFAVTVQPQYPQGLVFDTNKNAYNSPAGYTAYNTDDDLLNEPLECKQQQQRQKEPQEYVGEYGDRSTPPAAAGRKVVAEGNSCECSDVFNSHLAALCRWRNMKTTFALCDSPSENEASRRLPCVELIESQLKCRNYDSVDCFGRLSIIQEEVDGKSSRLTCTNSAVPALQMENSETVIIAENEEACEASRNEDNSDRCFTLKNDSNDNSALDSNETITPTSLTSSVMAEFITQHALQVSRREVRNMSDDSREMRSRSLQRVSSGEVADTAYVSLPLSLQVHRC